MSIVEDPCSSIADECSIPKHGDPLQFNLLCCTDTELDLLLNEYKELNLFGETTLAHHHIPTMGNPVYISPRRMPVYIIKTKVNIKFFETFHLSF